MTPTATPTSLELLSRRVDAISLTTSTLRELSFDAPVQREFIDYDEARVHLVEDFQDDRAEIEAQGDLFVTLGALEKGVDLYELLLDVYGEIILGFYEPEDEKIFVVLQDSVFGPLDELTMAHELVHGLQQQHYDIHSLGESVEGNLDKSLAFAALREGDATLAERLYMIQYMDQDETAEAQEAQASVDLSSFLAAPSVLQRIIAFPYTGGLGFAVTLFRVTNSWRPVNEAYAQPPASTEHILHPDKYLDGEQPIVVEVPALAEALGEGWDSLWEGTLGEFFLFAYLETWTEPQDAVTAAEGWGGDSYVLLRGPEGDNLVAWILEWDTSEDAVEFFDIVRDAAEVRTDARWAPDGEDDSSWLMDLGDQSLFAGIDGSRTVLIFAPDQDALASARSAIDTGAVSGP